MMKTILTPEIEALIDELAALAAPGDTPESLLALNLRGSIRGQRAYLEEMVQDGGTNGKEAAMILGGKLSLVSQG